MHHRDDDEDATDKPVNVLHNPTPPPYYLPIHSPDRKPYARDEPGNIFIATASDWPVSDDLHVVPILRNQLGTVNHFVTVGDILATNLHRLRP